MVGSIQHLDGEGHLVAGVGCLDSVVRAPAQSTMTNEDTVTSQTVLRTDIVAWIRLMRPRPASCRHCFLRL